MPERGSVQLLLPSLRWRAFRRFASCTAGALALVGLIAAAPMARNAAQKYALSDQGDIERLGLSAVALDLSEETGGSTGSAELQPMWPASEATPRQAVAVGDSIAVASSGGDVRRFRITGMTLLSGGCPTTDPQLLDQAQRGELCWTAAADGTLRFVIEVESVPEADLQPGDVQQKL